MMHKRKEKHINIKVLLLALAMLFPNITDAFHLFHHDQPVFVKSDTASIQKTEPDCHCCDLQLTPALIYTIGITMPVVSENFAQPFSFTRHYTGQYIPLHFQLRAPPVLS